MRSGLDTQLERLNHELSEMGEACRQSIEAVATAIAEGDKKVVKKIEPLHDEIESLERDLESLCMKMLLRQQPVARDLRQISAALKMITDMERIGHQALEIAEIVSTLKKKVIKQNEILQEMAQIAIDMTKRSIEALVRRDTIIASEVIACDDEMDEKFTSIRGQLIDLIAEDKTIGTYAVDLIMIAKYFERIGDHAVNFSQWTIFGITGKHDVGRGK